MNLNLIDPAFDFIVYDNEDKPLFRFSKGKLYEGESVLQAKELNPAYTNTRKRLEDYSDYELRGTKILLKGRGQLQFDFKKDRAEIARKTASGFFGDTYTKVGYIKYIDEYTNRQSLRLNPAEHEEVLKLISHLFIEHLNQADQKLEINAANDDEEDDTDVSRQAA